MTLLVSKLPKSSFGRLLVLANINFMSVTLPVSKLPTCRLVSPLQR